MFTGRVMFRRWTLFQHKRHLRRNVSRNNLRSVGVSSRWIILNASVIIVCLYLYIFLPLSFRLLRFLLLAFVSFYLLCLLVFFKNVVRVLTVFLHIFVAFFFSLSLIFLNKTKANRCKQRQWADGCDFEPQWKIMNNASFLREKKIKNMIDRRIAETLPRMMPRRNDQATCIVAGKPKSTRDLCV